jgi:glycosyltransferase involved in cell wall biosynthesis
MYPLISIIIPVYNGDRYLAEAIDSILAQNHQSIELIVVDDGSTDRTASIAQSYLNVRYIFQKNQGNAIAKNTGILAAQGEFIAFLDADDLWRSNKLSEQVNHLINYPDLDYVLCQMQTFLGVGINWPNWVKTDQINSDVSAYLPSALMVRKRVFEKIGNFNPAYQWSNDADWFFRAHDAGIPNFVIPQVLLYRRIHDTNLSYQTQSVNSELLQIVKSSVRRKSVQQLFR